MIYIGTSGWSYNHWNGVLYPENTPSRERLSLYMHRYNTVELNSSFYKWTNAATFRYWHRHLPDGFQMSVKAPRFLTHSKKLYAPERWIYRIANDLLPLKHKFGILLIQLSPNFELDYERLAYFLKSLPKGLRTTIEFRHYSWNQESVFSLLEENQVAYCIMSGANLPCILRSTTAFVYARLHGPDHNHLYAGSYSDNDMFWWATRCMEWNNNGKDVYIYFNNDGGGNAVRNADTFLRMVHANLIFQHS